MRLLKFRERDAQAGYRDFEEKIVELVRGYWRTNTATSLDSALGVLAGLNTKTLRHTVPPQQVTSFEGWLGSQGGFAIRARRLRSMNRGYQVSVDQRPRPDVDAELGSAGLALGFSVSAVGAVSMPPFKFGVSDRRGNFCPLKASNPVAEHVLESFWPSDTKSISAKSSNGTTRAPLGYIDVVTQLPSASSDESTWFAALVNRFPAEVYEIAQHSRDPARAVVAAALLGAVDSNAEWADRFGLLAGEHPWGHRSELVPLDIWRPVLVGGAGLVTKPAPCPVAFKRGDVWAYHGGSEPLPVPVQQWLVVENATVQDGGTIMSRGRLVVYDLSADPTLDFVSGQWDSVFGTAFTPNRALVRVREASAQRLPEGILLSGRNDDNWYHWMVEYLPRVFQIDSSLPSSAPFIVSSRTPPAGLDALRRIAERDVVVVDAALALEIKELHVLAPPVQILDTTRVPWSQGLSMNIAPLHEFRTRLSLGDQPLKGQGRRVFLQRTSSRRGLINQPELAQIATRMGLELVDPSALSWQDQIELFSSSSLIVGASGAVMANYLLMLPGSRILALTSDSLADFVLPAALAGVSHVAFSYLTGPNKSPLKGHLARNSWLHSSFSIRPDRFKRAVRHELASLGQ